MKSIHGVLERKNEQAAITDDASERHGVARENYNFVQMNRSFLKDWRLLTKKSPLATELLMYLIEHMGRTSNAVVVSYAVLAEILDTSKATVGRALKVLRDDNWIDTVRIGGTTAIAVNARAFWQAARNQKHYAVFQATVIAGASEQPSDYREKAKQKLRHIPIIDQDERAFIDAAEQLPPPDQTDLDLV